MVALLVVAGNTECPSAEAALRPIVAHALALRDAAMATGDLGTEANTLRNSLYCRPALATAALSLAPVREEQGANIREAWIVLEDPYRAGSYAAPRIVNGEETPGEPLRLRIVPEISEAAFRSLIESKLATR
jgi:hypothetical protein